MQEQIKQREQKHVERVVARVGTEAGAMVLDDVLRGRLGVGSYCERVDGLHQREILFARRLSGNVHN
jgi:hypothetical protein